MAVSPVIAAFRDRLVASFDDATRSRLIAPLDPRLSTSAASSRQVEVRRAFVAADWLVRTYVPRWLRLAGLTAAAVTLESLGEFVDARSFSSAAPVIDGVYADVVAWRAQQNVGPVDAVWDQLDGSNAAWMAIHEASKGVTQTPFSVAAIAEAALVLERAWLCGWVAAQVATGGDSGRAGLTVSEHRDSAGDLYLAMLDTTSAGG